MIRQALLHKSKLSPRAHHSGGGQQIRCESETDGHSPDKREREIPGTCVPARRALILETILKVNAMNQSNNAVALPGSDLSNSTIAYIEAGWHNDIVSRARESFTQKMAGRGVTEIKLFSVPGSLEIPLQTKLLAKTGQYDVIIAAGLIVDGGIYRHDFVASTVLDAMMRVSLDSEVPVLSVVLTPHHFHEHGEHHDFFFNHFVKKGEEAANACILTLENMQALKANAVG